MIFSEESDVSIVITSCGRFDLLKRTLESLDKFNTYPVKKILITEDSGNDEVYSYIPSTWLPYTQVFVNKPKLGQLESIDLAYSNVDTEWIFHCEDDWEFYREGFVEDSMALLEANPEALQVWLRSLAHDLSIHSPYVYVDERQLLNGISFFRLMSGKEDWQGFSFNPGLRRLADYKQHAPYGAWAGEKDLSRVYDAENRYALILENDAVLHTGFGSHVVVSDEARKKKRRKKFEKIKNIVFLILGLFVGFLLNGF